MTIRNDFTIDWEVSPRVILVDAPSDECTMQDLLDTLRNEEAKTANIDDPSIVDASGLEPLGAGVNVGLTVALQNAVIGFEARSGPDWIECNLSGGNLVAFDTDGVTTISPVYPTAFVFIAKTSSSSATQSNLAAIQYASYGDRVSMDITSAYSGADYPVGNVQYPVNNFVDTLLIANSEGFDSVEVRESCSINTGDFSGFNIFGKSHVNTTLTIDSPADVSKITLKQFRLEGTLDGGTEVGDCIIGDVVYFNGHIHDSSLGGRLTLGGSNESFISNCTRLESEVLPVIDFDDGNNHLVLSNYTGMVQFENMTVGTVNAMCGINRGVVILDTATCTAGTINLIGVGFLRDELGNNIPTGTWNGMTINNMLMSNESVAEAVLDSVA